MSDYYTQHADAYHRETFGIDPTPFLGIFVRHLTPGAYVLDVGCASGRDLVWLRRQGFQAIGFERSPGLAALARENSGCTVVEGDFTRHDFSRMAVDAVMMSGALVHVPHDRLQPALENIVRAITPDRGLGIVYISLKEGSGHETDDRGRPFYYWQDDILRELFARTGLDIIECQRSLSADGEGKSWLGYVLRRRG